MQLSKMTEPVTPDQALRLLIRRTFLLLELEWEQNLVHPDYAEGHHHFCTRQTSERQTGSLALIAASFIPVPQRFSHQSLTRNASWFFRPLYHHFLCLTLNMDRPSEGRKSSSKKETCLQSLTFCADPCPAGTALLPKMEEVGLGPRAHWLFRGLLVPRFAPWRAPAPRVRWLTQLNLTDCTRPLAFTPAAWTGTSLPELSKTEVAAAGDNRGRVTVLPATRAGPTR